jgi:predicted ATPase/DNA-binding SARP family transcriptional activator
VDFRILGPLEVSRDGEPCDLGARKHRALLALLLLHANEVVSVDRLIDELWGEAPPATAPKALQVYVSGLRRAIGRDVLATRAPGYMLSVDEGELDLWRFERLAGEGRKALAAGDPARAAAALGRALGLWRGPPLADLAYEPFAQTAIARLEELRLACLEDRIEADLALGRHAELVAELEALIREDPLRERLQAQLMLALYRSDRQAEALEVYRAARRVLSEELGIEPADELQRLQRAVLSHDPGLALPTEVKPAQAGPARRLPVAPSPIVGRERELAEVAAVLDRPAARLVTLTGAGGTGKSRLALEIATGMQSRFPDGVFFAALGAIRDPALIVPSIAGALEVTEGPGQPLIESLKHHLRDREVLLVVDNFEQVVEGAPYMAELLAAAPGLKLLVTSREPLRVSAESEYAVPPLGLPDLERPRDLGSISRVESVELFVQRALAADRRFRLTDDNAADVAKICARLDGLPLAIEMAAARIRALPPRAILARLDQRLRVLTGGARDLPARQRTLRATIDWSYDLLGPPERALFARLAVFAGGWTLEAAESVCGEGLGDQVVEVLGSLVEKSLVRREEPVEDQPRFGMLETLRDYALERLSASGEEPLLRRKHAAFFRDLGERAEPELFGAQQAAWLERVEADHYNLRSALGWCRTDPSARADGLRLAGSLFPFWLARGRLTEGRESLSGLLRRLDEDEPSPGHAKCLVASGSFAVMEGEVERAEALAGEGLRLTRRLGDMWWTAVCLNVLGTAARYGERHSDARTLYEEALTLCEEHGLTWPAAFTVGNLGRQAFELREYQRAAGLLERSLDLHRQVGEGFNVAATLSLLGWVAQSLGDLERAAALHGEGLDLWVRLENVWGITLALQGIAALAGLAGRPERAAPLLGAAESLRDDGGFAVWPTVRRECERDLEALRRALGADAFSAAWTEGRAMTQDQAVACAREEVRLPVGGAGPPRRVNRG